MSDPKSVSDRTVQTNRLIKRNITCLEERLSELKARLEAGEELGVKELEALNKAIELGDDMVAAW
ncbi:MAG: hypothetical protein CSA65_08955 [Proteobacteria bacterium]|nr:MAG: hypothetical protein CSA65_08955 [Pseudomonadota bacterium]